MLAISPAFEWLTALISILSDPFVLTVVLLLVGATAVGVRYQVDDVGTETVEWLAQCKEWLGFASPVVVRGSLNHGDVRWIGHHTRDGGTKVEYRACPHCAVELEQEPRERTKVNRPNTSITADKKTREREVQAWENVFGREKADSEELVRSLVCPRETCSFSILGEKHIKRGKSAVKKQFRTHFNDEMRTGGSDPFGKWHQRAKERLESDLEPTPADLWDAYVPQSDDDAVMRNRAFGHGLPGKDKSVTCVALEEHKSDAEGVNQLIELAPDPFDEILAWLVRSGYLEKRREITRKMNAEGETCRKELQSVEERFGSISEQVLASRDNRTEPRIDLESAEYKLNEANTRVSKLRADLDSDHLSFEKHRWFSTIKNGVADAVEYVEQLRVFAEYRRKIDPNIEAFEERFEPYDEGKNYMITPDKEFLEQECSTICQQLTDLHSKVRLELLPPEKTEWAKEKEDYFTGLSHWISDYNEEFVERERERYEDLFKTEHGQLNDEQQKAIVRNDLHNLVDASAGTGKTLTLTYRFLYLYRRGVPLDDIVAITFTGAAADEMESRIAAELDGVNKQQLNISTCHSLANNIVGKSTLDSSSDEYDPKEIHRRYAREFINGNDVFREDSHNAMDEFEDRHTDICNSEYIREHTPANKRPEDYLRELYTKFLNKARGFDKTPDEIRGQLTKDKRAQWCFGRAACAMLEAFLDYVESSDEAIDFPDMVQSATRIRRDNPEHFSGEYQHILFDEYQDVTESDLKFVETFLHEPEDTHLFAVGDDWQSIYGFRGADPSFFIEFDERFDGVEQTQLATNYRCPPTIVEAGKELMANSEADQNEKVVKAFNDSDVAPVVHKLSGIYEHRAAARVVKLIEDALSEDHTKPEDVMVLSRNDGGSPFMHRIRECLDDRGIPRIDLNDSDEMGDPDGVQVQSIHKSKGTQAEHVILVNARDNTHHGLPATEKENELLSPAIANTTNHYAEERRLFYVALTRTESQFDVITYLGNESRYYKDISSFFEEERSAVWTAEGVLEPWNYPSIDSNRPIETWLACDDYKVKLKTWKENVTQELKAGQRYRLSNFKPKNDGYGEEINLDNGIDIEALEPQ
jgi:superfamily I DNA/RNA helicase